MSWNRWSRLFMLFVVCGLILGCQNNGSSKPDADGDHTKKTSESNDSPKTQPKSGDGVTVKVMSYDATLEFIKGQTGKVVVVDFWSTTCVPCLREFPQLVELHHKRGEQVACISVSLDFYGETEKPSDELKQQVLEKLIEMKADCENILCSDPSKPVYDRVEFVSIPAVRVYDQKGKLRKTFANEEVGKPEFTYEKDIVPFVEKLLAEK